MKTILFYGDSNTWGYVPGAGTRFPYERRWTSIVRKKLGPDYDVIVEALNGRTTVFDDPLRSARNGQFAFSVILESHAPINLLVIMLGSNDCKEHLHNRAVTIARGMRSLVELARGKGFGPDGGDPKILILSPPLITKGDQRRANFDLREFTGAQAIAAELSREYQKIAAENACYFLDTAPIAKPSPIDGLHLTVESNAALGEWIGGEIVKLEF
ncbi:MAG: SGNH/GDSL hydrolase family protein [Treponema sp.]|jgi:lysophospholipase L1-like esterase|nr:SGNH/GDSL hydrolase family protein [Treponema sp.]